MKLNVQGEEVFIFVNRNLTIMKILHMEHGGLVIYHKKLENGVFKLPVFDETENSQVISWYNLMRIVSDVSPSQRKSKER